jgi:hypothetical protein
MDEREVSEALRDWALDVCDDAALAPFDGLVVGYAFLVDMAGNLPNVMVDLQHKGLKYGPDERFPYAELQQVWLRIFDANLSFMVASEGLVSDRAEQETQHLQKIGAVIEQAVQTNADLGGRVQMASPLLDFNYALPFVQYDDGTKGRQMILSIAVAELIEEPEA